MLRLANQSSIRIIVEDAATAKAVEKAGVGPYEYVTELISGVWDLNAPEVMEKAANLLRDLADALGVSEWNYAGVSLWDVISGDFLLYHLDGLFQATDMAKQLLAITRARGVFLGGLNSPLARALAAVGRTQDLSVEVIEKRLEIVPQALRVRLLPYLGHIREYAKGLWYRRRERPQRHAPFVIVNHTARNFLSVLPVLHELKKTIPQERILVLQIGLEGLEKVQEAGFDYVRFECYTSLREGAHALQSIGTVVEFLTSGKWRDSVARVGVDWDGMPLATLAEPEISFGLARLLCNAARMVACARAMLNRESPAIVLLTNERAGFGRAIGLAARTASIPSILVPGLIRPHPLWLPGIAADIAAVEGEASAEVIRKGDITSEVRVAVTGPPKHDLLLSRAAATSRPTICERYGVDPDRPIVLYASHAFGEQSAKIKRNFAEQRMLAREIEAVYGAVNSLTDVQLVVKPHPNEEMRLHQETLERLKGRNLHLIAKNEEIYPLLFACDVLVTHRSTVGLEAVLLDKPVVIVNLTGRPDAFPYVQSGVAIGAYDAFAVQPVIRAALFDPVTRQQMAASRPGFLCRYAFRGNVSATDQVVDLALGLAQERLAD